MTITRHDPSDDRQPAPPDAAAVPQALTRILASDEFEGASRIQSFLSYVVEETLEGRGSQIRAKIAQPNALRAVSAAPCHRNKRYET